MPEIPTSKPTDSEENVVPIDGIQRAAQAPSKLTAIAPIPKPVNTVPAIFLKKKVTKRGLARYQEQMLLAWTPELLPIYFEAIQKGLVKGEKETLRLVSEMYGYVQKSGISIVNNLNQNNNTMNVSEGRGFDRIVRTIQSNQEAIEVIPTPVQESE